MDEEWHCESCGSTEQNFRSSQYCPECQCTGCGGLGLGYGSLCPDCQDIEDEAGED